MVIKYKVEKSFKDKYSKEDVIANNVIEVSIERMKELNAKNIGRVIDIVEDSESTNNMNVKTDTEIENPNQDSNTTKEQTIYTEEKLSEMTVNELKDLAEQLNIELTKAKKEDIIKEILEKNI